MNARTIRLTGLVVVATFLGLNTPASAQLSGQFQLGQVYYAYSSKYVTLVVDQVLAIDTSNSSETRVTVRTNTGASVVVRFPAYQLNPGTFMIDGNLSTITRDLMMKLIYEYRDERSRYTSLVLTNAWKPWYSSMYTINQSSSVKLVTSNPIAATTSGFGGGIVEAVVEEDAEFYAQVTVRRDDGTHDACKLLRRAGTYDGASLQPMSEARARDFFNVGYNGVPFLRIHSAERIPGGTRIAHSLTWWQR